MSDDPLKNALDEISADLDERFQPIVAALKSGSSVEEAWETLLQEILDEA